METGRNHHPSVGLGPAGGREGDHPEVLLHLRDGPGAAGESVCGGGLFSVEVVVDMMVVDVRVVEVMMMGVEMGVVVVVVWGNLSKACPYKC